MKKRHIVTLVTAVLLSACSRPPSEAEVASAKATVTTALTVSQRVSTVLKTLGILPDYTCGEPRRVFVGKVAAQLPVTYACVQTQHDAAHATQDGLALDFDKTGCTIDGLSLAGQAAVTYEGGESRLSVTTDITALKVDGHALGATAGYATCGDEQTAWVKANGEISPEVTYSVQVSLAARKGLPIIGSDSYVINGPATVTRAAGAETVTFTNLTYEGGALLPSEGTLEVATSNGDKIRAEFSSDFFFGKAKITVNELEPVTVPLAP